MIKFRIGQRLGIISILSGLIFLASCEEWMVGAPCKPETDVGTYVPNLTSSTYALETRSVQCQTSVCITKTEYRDSDTQFKYSFCSCRCKDKNGHKYDRNSDKYDDLCECPSGTVCSEDVVNNNIDQIPDTLKGSYCLPGCIDEPCTEVGGIDYKCTPPNDSEEPWKWKCKPSNS